MTSEIKLPNKHFRIRFPSGAFTEFHNCFCSSTEELIEQVFGSNAPYTAYGVLVEDITEEFNERQSKSSLQGSYFQPSEGGAADQAQEGCNSGA